MDEKVEYYDGTKLLSLKDAHNKEPEIYICTSNRTAGKTTYFNRYLVNGFLKRHRRFMLLYRFDTELTESADKFFKDIKGLFFNEYEMTSQPRAKGKFIELYLNDISCGYAVAINAADYVKKFSHLFSDIDVILMDEFMPESNQYAPEEIRKFRSIHTSVARGQGKMVRRVPVILVGNPVTLLNPYYTAMKISSRLTPKTRFLRGNGFVLEQGHNDSAARAQEQSAFNRCFENDAQYDAYLKEGVYLNDNLAFIEKPKGNSKYLATIKYSGQSFAIRQYSSLGVIYCDDRPDSSFPTKISVSAVDHDVNYVLLKQNDMLLAYLKFLFRKGAFRFKDLRCKEAVMCLLSF